MSSPYQQITEYIAQHRKSGISEEKIRDHLTRHGWAQTHIDRAFNEYTKESSLVSPANKAQPKQKEKYSLVQIVRDISQAIAFNSVAYSVSIVTITAGLLICIALLGPLVIAVGINIVTIILLLFTVPIVVSVTQTFIYSVMNVLLNAYLKQTKLQPLQPLLKVIKSMRRIALANLLWNAIAYLPFLLIIPVLFIESYAIFVIIPLLALICLVWALIIGLRYCLSPAIAQYEPELAIRASLRRSQKLLSSRGQWLVVLGAIILATVQAIIGTINSDNVIVVLVQLIAIIVVTTYGFGGLSAIYFNRAAVQK